MIDHESEYKARRADIEEAILKGKSKVRTNIKKENKVTTT